MCDNDYSHPPVQTLHNAYESLPRLQTLYPLSSARIMPAQMRSPGAHAIHDSLHLLLLYFVHVYTQLPSAMPVIRFRKSSSQTERASTISAKIAR
jgi:hypothetical protein